MSSLAESVEKENEVATRQAIPDRLLRFVRAQIPSARLQDVRIVRLSQGSTADLGGIVATVSRAGGHTNVNRITSPWHIVQTFT